MLSELARQLDGKGQIAADYVTRSLAKNGEPASISVTFGNLDATSKLLSRFGIGAAKARREVAYTHLCDLVRRSGVSNGEQLLANIRKVVEHTGKLKGKDVAAEIRHFLGDDPAKVLKGADVAPQATGTIRLMAVSPLRIIADHTIVRSSTMADAVGNNRDQRDIADTLRDKMQEIV